jgi:hypothetical protein
MRVRLIRKLADMIDGVDLRPYETGDIFEIPAPEARLLVAEQWAIPERRAVDRGEPPRQFMSRSPTERHARDLSVAADRPLKAATNAQVRSKPPPKRPRG